MFSNFRISDMLSTVGIFGILSIFAIFGGLSIFGVSCTQVSMSSQSSGSGGKSTPDSQGSNKDHDTNSTG
ncbi:hypothetical protein CWI39_1939p0010, partial [Hamiltosporidium magnivora]